MTALKVCLFILTGYISSANAATYYFSSLSGNDSRSFMQAQNPATPWKTLNKLNSVMADFQPGDSVLFKRGEKFDGSFSVSKSGTVNRPLVFSAYGKGEKPIISGFTTLTNWTDKGNGIWETSCQTGTNLITTVLVDGKEVVMGRYPNSDASYGGYLTIESHSGKTQLTDNHLSTLPDWTGGEVVIRKNHWIIDRNLITGQKGNILTYSSGSKYEAKDKYGYFIQNHIGTLDQFGEWFYDSKSNTLSIYLGKNPASSFTLEASTTDILLRGMKHSNIIFDNLCFKGANLKQMEIGDAEHISIQNCDLLFSGNDGVELTGNYFQIENCLLSNSHNNAITVKGNNCTIRNCVIKNSAIFPGLGKSGDLNYNAIGIFGNSNRVVNNTIDSVGYIPIYFEGDSVLIKNNFISDFTLVKDDGGGIYTFTGAGKNPKNGSAVTGNIILNGKGASEGTDSQNGSSHGIYLDDNSANTFISGNTVANCSGSGIFLHNTNGISIRRNTFFNNGIQLQLSHDNNSCKDCSMSDNKIIGNIFFSKTQNQLVALLETFADDIGKFGIFDSNSYSRPIADNSDILVKTESGKNTIFSLSDWQTEYSQDAASKKSPIIFPSYTVTDFVGDNKFKNGTFDSNVSGLYCYSPLKNCSTSWDNSGKLDKGSVRISFSPVPGKQNFSTLIAGVGSVFSEKNYILKFSLSAKEKNKTIGVYLRQSQSPYKKLTPINYFRVKETVREHEFMFSSPVSENDASIGVDFENADSTVWLDNLKLLEAKVSPVNPDDYIRFEYNKSQSVKTIFPADTLLDVNNNRYSGKIELNPFTSLILLKKP